MSVNILIAYLDAWNVHCDGKAETMEAMVAASHPELRNEDINSPAAQIGHEGVRAICKMASKMHAGAVMNYRGLVRDGRDWAVQWEISGMQGGKAFKCRGASTGKVADDGRVIQQTDYWNPAHLQA